MPQSFNHIVINVDDYLADPTDPLARFAFDDMLGTFQPKAQQLEVLVRPGHDGESTRYTGIRAVPTQIVTLHGVLDRQAAVDALVEYIALIDGSPYAIIQHDQNWGYFKILSVAQQQLIPMAAHAGWLIPNATIVQVNVWTVVSTDPPEP